MDGGEVKLGSMAAVDTAADTLNRVCTKVDPVLSGTLVRKVVITASVLDMTAPME